mgnify:CR=1 FL=1
MMTELKRAGGNELRDFKELSLEELRRGYVIHRDGTYTCIFCGASFETGVIYHSRGRDGRAGDTGAYAGSPLRHILAHAGAG